MLTRAAALTFVLTLTACGPSADKPGPGGVSTDDAQALDEAAAKLDAEARQNSPK
ncbi:MAG: hypothetical protein ABI668_13745 [Sphingorhabdus sp.]